MSSESLLNYLKYQQEVAGDELILPGKLDLETIVGNSTSQSGNKTSQKPVAKFVPVIPEKIKKDPVKFPEINLPSKRPQSQKSLPEFKSLKGLYKYLEEENLYRLNQQEKHEPYPIVKCSGPTKSRLCIISMVPSESDLETGIIFSGKDGELLAKMLKAIGIEKKEVFCTSVVKNPEINKKLYHTQKGLHLEIVLREIALTGGKSILLLGEKCAQNILKTGKSLKELRDLKHKLPKNNILKDADFWVVEHPQKLIQSPGLKHQAWKDLKWIQTQL